MLGNKNLSYRIIVAIMLAMSLLVSLLILVLLYSIDRLEHDLLENQNNVELQRLHEEFKHNPDYQLPQTAKLRIYMEGQNDPPAYISQLPLGYHSEVSVDDATYFVLVDRVNQRKVYLVNDISAFETSETRMGWIIALSWLILMALIFAVSFLLSRQLLKPISDFAEEIDSLRPEQRGLKLSGKYHGLEIAKITRAFDQYLSKLDEYVERQHAFSAMASHELRTPLTVVQTSAELIATETDNPLIQQQCKTIHRSSTRMRDMILALLSITRDRPSNSESHSVELGSLLHEILDNFSNEIKHSRIQIDNRIEQDSCLTADPTLLSVVINNLISNAIKHAPRGVIEIDFKADQLSISDNGSGLDRDDIEQLFKFGVAGKNSGGYGLGLYISRLICDQQGWLLELLPANPGTLARVTFSTPSIS